MNAPSDAQNTIRVAIIGAGIGGLTLSVAIGALQKRQDLQSKLQIDLYESASIISEIGAGITLWPRVWKIMNAIDLGESLVQFLPRPPDDSTRLVFQLRKADQLEGVFVHDVMMQGGSTTFHRADLQQTLVNKLTGNLHLGYRLSSYDEVGDEIIAHFENGATVTCDLLVGMDGIKSTVRRSLLAKQGLPNSPSMGPIWSGTIAYRGLVPRDELDKVFPGHRTITTPMMYVGKLKHVVAYAISRQFINVAAFVTYPSKEGTVFEERSLTPIQIHEELISLYTSFETEVKVLLDCMKEPLKWPINQVIPVESYVRGRALIAGDAAHGLPPHQGSGASTAIEDAYILASLLTSPSCSIHNLPKLSFAFDSIRCPKGNRALETAIGCGRLLDLVYPGLEDTNCGDDDVDQQILHSLGKKVAEEWAWVWRESAEDDRRHALEILDGVRT